MAGLEAASSGAGFLCILYVCLCHVILICDSVYTPDAFAHAHVYSVTGSVPGALCVPEFISVLELSLVQYGSLSVVFDVLCVCVCVCVCVCCQVCVCVLFAVAPLSMRFTRRFNYIELIKLK